MRSARAQPRHEREQHLDRDQRDDDPLERLGARAARAVLHLAVEALDRLELAQDAGVPLGEPEALRRGAVDAREVLVADQLDLGADALEQDRALDLEAAELREPAARPSRRAQRAEAPRLRHDLLR